jgi:hypothetical protein
MSPTQTKDNRASQQGLGGLLSEVFDAPRDLFAYETIRFSGRLEILDPNTRSARFVRRQRIRFLEDGVSVFMDRVWGEGVLFAGYAAPGLKMLEPIRTPKGYVLPLQLPRPFGKGDVFDIVTERRIIGAFYHPLAYWDTAMSAPTELISIEVAVPPGADIRRPEIVAPARGDMNARQRQRSLEFRVARPAMNVPYKLAWSWQ